MKKLHIMLFSALLAVSAQINATSIGDKANYERNSGRTSKIITAATGTLSIADAPSGKSCNGGMIVKLDYDLNVILKGNQKGSIGVCVPNSMLQPNFYGELARGVMHFGAFDLEHKGFVDAKDMQGIAFPGCHHVRAMNVDHNQKRENNMAKAEVLWVDHKGSIASVRNIEVSFKAATGIPVLGAVEVDVKGITNNNIPFTVGMDIRR